MPADLPSSGSWSAAGYVISGLGPLSSTDGLSKPALWLPGADVPAVRERAASEPMELPMALFLREDPAGIRNVTPAFTSHAHTSAGEE